MIEVYRGERRYLSVDLANVLAAGDSLTGSPTAVVVVKRGRAVTELVDEYEAVVVSGTEVRFWVDIPADTARGTYLAIVEVGTANGEVAREEAPLLVE